MLGEVSVFMKKVLIVTLIMVLVPANLFLWSYLYDSYKKTVSTTAIVKANEIYKDNDYIEEDSKIQEQGDIEKDIQTSSDNKDIEIEDNFYNSTNDTQEENIIIESSSDEPDNTNTKIINNFNGEKVHNLKAGQQKLVHSSIYSDGFLYWENGDIYSDGERVQLEIDATLIAYNPNGGGEIYRNNFSGSVEGNRLSSYSEEGIGIEYKLESVFEEGYQKLKMVLYIDIDPLAEFNKLYNIKLNVRGIGEGNRTKFVIGSETNPKEDIYINVLENERIDND